MVTGFHFLQIPREYISQNNKSALENEEFLSKAIDELLQSGSVIQVPFKPTIVNPLSVAFSSAGKPRLILDLRFVNNHLIKEHITFDDWRVFEQFVAPSGYLFKFDFRKGYHHVDIFPDHQLFMGFSWDIGGIDLYFVFTVLPFGLSTAPAVFTKVLRPLVSHWHQNGIKIAVYLDDGFGLGHSLEEANVQSNKVRDTLELSGFLANKENSVWKPSRCLTWLGVTLDLDKNTYQITEERIFSLLNSIDNILKSPYTSARVLSRLAGKIVSTKFVLSNIIRLKTRSIYKTIDRQLSWDGKFNILNHPEAHREILS